MDQHRRQRVAVIGSGISGLSLAWALAKSGKYDVSLFESEDRLGGHTYTADSGEFVGAGTGTLSGTKESVRVDLGFQVMNRTTYPYLSAFFQDLRIDTEPSDMSFAVSVNGGERLEWASHNLDSLFATRTNVYSPKFLHMIKEIFRFASCAPEVLTPDWQSPEMTLGEYLKSRSFDETFASDYLIPMTAAVWSVPHSQMLQFPVVPLIRFWANHHLLNPLGNRPRWRVVKDRTQQYISALESFFEAHGVEIFLSSPVRSVTVVGDPGVTAGGISSNGKLAVVVGSDTRTEHGGFDHVAFAAHSDIAHGILTSPDSNVIGTCVSAEEVDLLGSIPYQANDIYLHTDASQMPKNKRAWASWNVLYNDEEYNRAHGIATDQSRESSVCVSYWLNRLQNLPPSVADLFCTLNPISEIPKEHVRLRTVLHHPVFNIESVAAQEKLNKIQAFSDAKQRSIWFAGAYLGSGFHEDGIRSAMAVAAKLDAAPDFVREKHPALELTRGPSPDSTLVNRLGVQLFSAIAAYVIQRGHLRIVLPDGDEIGPFGRASRDIALHQYKEPSCTMWVNSYDALLNCVKDSDIGLGVAYMDGMISFDENGQGVMDLLNILVLNLNRLVEMDQKTSLASTLFTAPLFSLSMLVYRWGNTINNIKHRLRKNTVAGSRKNIQAHYDIGNPLYELFLDESMTYSSGIHTKRCGADLYSPGAQKDAINEDTVLDLHEAQMAKLDAIIAKAELRKTDVVLEIGCGWGSFAMRAAETVGCMVIGITISTEQLKVAQRRVRERGLEHLVDLRICDYRKLGVEADTPPNGFFDKVVSIEMLEAVGEEHLGQYFQVVNRMLKPGGKALIQVIGIPDERYEAYCRGSDFIREHVFPGGHLPSLGALSEAIDGTTLSLVKVDDIGLDYAITLRMWRERFLRSKQQVLALGYPERFVRLWEFYLAYCEVGFTEKSIHDWHLKYEKSLTVPGSTSPSSVVHAVDQTDASSRAPGKLSLAEDPFTSALFAVWFLMCALAVQKIGIDSLLIPVFMSIQVVPNALLGHFSIFRGSAAKRSPRAARFSGLMLTQVLSSALLLATAASLGFLTESEHFERGSKSKAIVMLALGHYAGELFSLSAGGLFRMIGSARVAFLTCALVLGSVVMFSSQAFAPMFETMEMIVLTEITASAVKFTRSVLSLRYHFTLKSRLYQVVAAMDLLSSVLFRAGFHILYVFGMVASGTLVGEALQSSDVLNSSLLYSTMIMIALYDCWEIADSFLRTREDLANSWNTHELIKAQPEQYLKATHDLVSELAQTNAKTPIQ